MQRLTGEASLGINANAVSTHLAIVGGKVKQIDLGYQGPIWTDEQKRSVVGAAPVDDFQYLPHRGTWIVVILISITIISAYKLSGLLETQGHRVWADYCLLVRRNA